MRDIKSLQGVFAKRLKDLVQTKNISFAELSRQTGIPATTISSWIQLKRSPQMDSLSELADYFSVTVDYLLGREPD